jgi:hypothetical protein
LASRQVTFSPTTAVPAGVYLLRLEAGTRASIVTKIVLTR